MEPASCRHVYFVNSSFLFHFGRNRPTLATIMPIMRVTMGKNATSCSLLRLLAILVMFAWGTAYVHADDRDEEIVKLKARLDALEQKTAPEADLPVRPVDLLTQPPLIPAQATAP